IALCFVALFSDFLANEKPIVCSYKGVVHFPILREYLIDMGLTTRHPDLLIPDWQNLLYDWAIPAPIPYSITNQHSGDGSLSPFAPQIGHSLHLRHWLGTDDLGRDVLSAMIHGTRVAFMVGILSMSISFILGIFIGSLAGFWGDDGLKIPRIYLFTQPFFLFLAYFYGFYTRSYTIADALSVSFVNFVLQGAISLGIFIFVLVLGYYIFRPIARSKGFFGKNVSIAVDLIITRCMEVLSSIPLLVVILVVLSVTRPSIYSIMAILGLMGWPNIARFVRAELLRIRRLEYIEAAHALGFGTLRVLLRHALPNALAPVFIVVAFGIANAILIESTLSFLGIGSVELTWGKLLDLARDEKSNWWLAVFPGFAIFMTMTLFNLIGEGLIDALDPRLKE
ncbi:MAG: hypothetical protein RI894_436, partial [Bacteroidota bacterium]